MNFLLFAEIFIILGVAYFAGYSVKKYFETKNSGKKVKIGTVEGSLLALFAFFLSYTISIASNKFVERKNIVIQESNKIGTAYLRTQLFSGEEEINFKNLFEEYVKVRIDYFNANNIDPQSKIASDKTDKIGKEIWDYSANLFKSGKYPEASRQLIPALNDMLDQVSVRAAIFDTRMAKSILWTLYILSISSSFIVGFSNVGNFKTDVIGLLYITITSLVIYLILDSDRTNTGLINAERANKTFIDLLKSIQAD